MGIRRTKLTQDKISRVKAAEFLGITVQRLDYQIRKNNIKKFKWLGETHYLTSDIEKLNEFREIK